MIRKIQTFFLLFILLTAYAAAQQNVLTSYNIFNLKSAVETAVSPDGKKVAYTVIVPRPFTDEPGSDYRTLHVYDLAAGSSKEIIGEKTSITSIGWMPDGERIIFKAKLLRRVFFIQTFVKNHPKWLIK